MTLRADSTTAGRFEPLGWYLGLSHLLERLAPLADLLLRLAVFRLFFWSGLT